MVERNSWCRGDVLMVDAVQNKSAKLYSVSSRPVGVPAKARSALVGWLEPGSSLFKPQNNHQTPKQPPLYNPYPRSSAPLSAYICVNRLSRDPVFGVAKSVCHRDRRSLPNRQLRCLCRTDFGSPRNKLIRLYTVSSRASVLDPGSNAQRGGKVRLPQRPEVSSKQATQLPLPNGLRQPPEQIPPDHKASSSQPVSRDPVFLFNTSHFRPVWPLFGRINLRKTYPASLAAFWPDYFVVR